MTLWYSMLPREPRSLKSEYDIKITFVFYNICIPSPCHPSNFPFSHTLSRFLTSADTPNQDLTSKNENLGSTYDRTRGAFLVGLRYVT